MVPLHERLHKQDVMKAVLSNNQGGVDENCVWGRDRDRDRERKKQREREREEMSTGGKLDSAVARFDHSPSIQFLR